METKIIDLKNSNDYTKLIEAAEAIKQGKLVLFPTETVYGIGANALNEEAVKNIYVAKGRASDNPLIVHISDKEMLKDLVLNIGETERALIEKFWPGPLTIVFNKNEKIPTIVTGGLDTVAIRMPSSSIARELIQLANLPIAAPSANISGRPSGTILEDIMEELDGKVEYMIDGGKVQIGLESTVIRVVDDTIHILRPGKITKEDMEALGFKVAIEKQILGEYDPKEKVMSPGIKYKHYAPNTKTIMVYSKDPIKMAEKINEIAKDKDAIILCKTEHEKKYINSAVLVMGNTLEEISNNIFTLLRKADKQNKEIIIIEGVEKEGLGLAIMNRLLRACSHNFIEL